MTYQPNEFELQNYIQNKLSETEVEQVELWLVDHPEVMDDFDMGVMFKQGIKKQSLQQEPLNNWWQFIYSKPLFALSHVVLFSLGIVFSHLIFNPQIENEISTPNVELIDQLRSESTQRVMSNENDLLIQITVNYLFEDTYSVTINDSKNLSYSVKDVNTHDSLVSLLIPGNYLSNGSYVLILKNERTNEEHLYNFVIH